jgi:polar amino acid transport system permease protein
MSFNWSWEYAIEVLPELLFGFQVTVMVTIFGMTLALMGGLLLAVLRRMGFKPVAWTADVIVEFIRSTPLLVQIFFIYFVLPEMGIRLPDFGGPFSSEFMTGVLVLGIHYSSYTAEVYRAGIESIPRGQWEAAVALNFSPMRTWTNIILPQSIPPVVPALGNYLIAMFKDTPLLYAIAVMEVLTTAQQIGSENFRYVEPITIVGLLFLVVSLLSAWGVRRLEQRVKLPGR